MTAIAYGALEADDVFILPHEPKGGGIPGHYLWKKLPNGAAECLDRFAEAMPGILTWISTGKILDQSFADNAEVFKIYTGRL